MNKSARRWTPSVKILKNATDLMMTAERGGSLIFPQQPVTPKKRNTTLLSTTKGITSLFQQAANQFIMCTLPAVQEQAPGTNTPNKQQQSSLCGEFPADADDEDVTSSKSLFNDPQQKWKP